MSLSSFFCATFGVLLSLLVAHCTGEKILAPSTFWAKAVDNESIRFEWQIPTQPMAGLSVRLWVWNNSETHMNQIFPVKHLMTAIVSGLHPFTEYNTSLSIHNIQENVNATCSKITKVRTFPYAPNFSILKVWDNSVCVKFEPLKNGAFVNVIYIASTTSEYNLERECSTDASNRDLHCCLDNLYPRTRYNIKSMACVYGECSVKSTAIEVQTPGVAGFYVWPALPDVLNAKWDSTFAYNSSSEFRIRVEDKLDPMCRQPLNKTHCNCAMKGYSIMKRYYTRIVACKLNETNPENCIYIQSAEHSSEAIVGRFYTYDRGPRTIYAEWDLNKACNSSLEFRITVNDTLESTCRQPTNKTFFNCEMDGYTPNSKYYVQLVLCNISETKPQRCLNMSYLDYVYTPPEAPGNVTVVAVDSHNIRLSWKMPPQPMSDMNFVIFAWRNKTFYESYMENAENLNTYIIGGLTPLSEYEITLCVGYRYLSCSENTTVLTPPNAPTLKVTKVGVNSIEVDFEVMQDAKSFDVIYAAVADDVDGNQRNCSARVQNGKVGCVLKGLRRTTVYKIAAMACFESNCSPKVPRALEQTLVGGNPQIRELPHEEHTT